MKKYLENNILIADGAIGTYYAQLTGSDEIPELANIRNPKIVEQIHREYVAAGARLIRTNTFVANKRTLNLSKEQLRELIQSAYELACRVANDAAEKVWVAADIGPISESAFETEEHILEEYLEVCNIFIDLGAKVFLFETFSSLKYIEPLVKYIKSRTDAFIITQFSLNPYGFTKYGVSAKRLFHSLSQVQEIDAYGFNCGVSATHLNKIIKKLSWNEAKAITVMPNASYPELISGRSVYTDNIEYFVDVMKDIYDQGVNILGGCCGTTPKHIEALVASLPKERILHKNNAKNENTIHVDIDYSNNDLFIKFEKGKKVIAVELDPPYDTNYDKLIEDAYQLKEQGVDIITIADSPLGKPRVDSILMASKIKQMVNIPVMPHMCCRDKNSIAIKAQLLGANIQGINNMLFVTGDAVPAGDRDEIKGVFNMNSVQLMKLVSEMNIENFQNMPFYFGGAIDAGKKGIEAEIKKTIRKMEAGAKFFLTQPIFEDRAIENLKLIKEQTGAKILAGIMPIVSYKNARFMDNEIPGINIPREVMEQFEQVVSREDGEKVGKEVALEVIKKIDKIVDGYYFIVPFNRVYLISNILQMLKSEVIE